MTPIDRKVGLLRRKKSLSSIARALGVSLTHVSQVNGGHRRSPRVEQAIADALEMPVEQAFDGVPEMVA